jgi:hypothetical protein
MQLSCPRILLVPADWFRAALRAAGRLIRTAAPSAFRLYF